MEYLVNALGNITRTKNYGLYAFSGNFKKHCNPELLIWRIHANLIFPLLLLLSYAPVCSVIAVPYQLKQFF